MPYSPKRHNTSELITIAELKVEMAALTSTVAAFADASARNHAAIVVAMQRNNADMMASISSLQNESVVQDSFDGDAAATVLERPGPAPEGAGGGDYQVLLQRIRRLEDRIADDSYLKVDCDDAEEYTHLPTVDAARLQEVERRLQSHDALVSRIEELESRLLDQSLTSRVDELGQRFKEVAIVQPQIEEREARVREDLFKVELVVATLEGRLNEYGRIIEDFKSDLTDHATVKVRCDTFERCLVEQAARIQCLEDRLSNDNLKFQEQALLIQSLEARLSGPAAAKERSDILEGRVIEQAARLKDLEARLAEHGAVIKPAVEENVSKTSFLVRAHVRVWGQYAEDSGFLPLSTLPQITVKRDSGVGFPLRVEPSDTVQCLKLKIQAREGIHTTAQVLGFQDLNLGRINQTETMAALQIDDGSVIHLKYYHLIHWPNGAHLR